jgi:hypothetical protein
MKNNISIALFIIAAGLAVTTGLAKVNRSYSQSINLHFNVKDMPENGLNIVAPSNPEYKGLMESQFKGRNAVAEALQPFSIFIKNTGDKVVVAFSLKWDLMNADGKVLTQTRNYITLWKLMGENGSDSGGHIIKPGGVAFAVPSHLQVSQGTDDAGSSLDPEGRTYLDNLRTELAQYTSITVSLDGVFFEDGAYVGDDNGGFFSKVEAIRNAKRDLYAELSQALKQGNSAGQVLKRVEEIAAGQEVAPPSNTAQPELYLKHRKDAAAELLRMRTALGDKKAVEYFDQESRKRRPELRKVNGNEN